MKPYTFDDFEIDDFLSRERSGNSFPT